MKVEKVVPTYSKDNEPSSMKLASLRMEWLVEEIASIDRAIKKGPRDRYSMSEITVYSMCLEKDWNPKLKVYKNELKFITRWIAKQTVVVSK